MWRNQDRNPAYNKAAWRRARLACLRAANWRCQIRGPNCTLGATTADHVRGLRNDPEHRELQAACQKCHDEKTIAESHTARWGTAAQRDPEPLSRTAW